MTNVQKITLRLSQVRQRLNADKRARGCGLDRRNTGRIHRASKRVRGPGNPAPSRHSCGRRNRDAGERNRARFRGPCPPRATIYGQPHGLHPGGSLGSPGRRPRGRATGRGRDRKRDPLGIVGCGPSRKRGDAARRCDGRTGNRRSEPGRHPARRVRGFDCPSFRYRNAARRIRVLRKRDDQHELDGWRSGRRCGCTRHGGRLHGYVRDTQENFGTARNPGPKTWPL